MPKLLTRLGSILAIKTSFASDRRASAASRVCSNRAIDDFALSGRCRAFGRSCRQPQDDAGRANDVADLVAQDLKLTDAGRDDVLKAAKAVASPYGDSNLTVIVSSIKIDNTGTAKVEWSEATTAELKLAKDSTVTLKDAALAAPNTWLILGQATYKYTPTFGKVSSSNPIPLTDKICMRPRISPNVQRTAN